MELTAKCLNADLWNDFQAYFEYKGSCSGCWCMNHRLPVGLDFEGEAAKLAMKQLVESNRVYGVLAYQNNDSIPVGWASLDRKQTLPGHDCIDKDINCSSTIWSIHCLSARSDVDKDIVIQFLSKKSIELCEELGGSEVEVYPEPGSSNSISFKTWNTFTGFEKTFFDLGFEKMPHSDDEKFDFYSPLKKNL